MKNSFTLRVLLFFILLPILGFSQTFYSVKDVYTNPDIESGDTILVAAYFTDTSTNYLIDNYGTWDLDQVMEPHTFLIVEGMEMPQNAWNGGYLVAQGSIRYEINPNPYWEADSLIAYLNLLNVQVLLDGDIIPGNSSTGNDEGSVTRVDCDSCKFAVLVSGGVDTLNNHSKYWENLVALYNFKVDSLGYCPDNVFVHYFKGDRRDNRIQQERVFVADSASIANSHAEISKRVAKCTEAGKNSVFQKMITNHGAANGDIHLLDHEEINPADLRNMQQPIIDSCCSLVYDEFLQCYGGYSVDSMRLMNSRKKAKIYANSNADHQSGHSPHNRVHPYLVGKINALDAGLDYEDAVVAGKMGYDNYLRQTIMNAHRRAEYFRTHPGAPDAANQLARAVADSTTRANKICSSRNIVITPMNNYCQWEKFVVPAGGQLVLDFSEGDSASCGNVTVYKEDSATSEKVKVKEWNWNLVDSHGYEEGNDRRVINGDSSSISTYWVHNDNNEYVITAEIDGMQPLEESPSNALEYPGFSFGGTDNTGLEFGYLMDPSLYFENIDMLGFGLYSLPAHMGPNYVEQLGFSFAVNPTDMFWTEMELFIKVSWVGIPDTIYILSELAENPIIKIAVNEPGVFHAYLGDMTAGFGFGDIMISSPNCLFEFDCWGLRSLYVPSVGFDDWGDPYRRLDDFLTVAPNPFDQNVKISFELKNSGEVHLSVYDMIGREISVIHDGKLPVGKQQFNFNGRSDSGQELSKGLYFVRIRVDNDERGLTKIVKVR